MASVAPQLISSPEKISERLTILVQQLRSAGEDLLKIKPHHRTFKNSDGSTFSLSKDPILGDICLIIPITTLDHSTHLKHTDAIQAKIQGSSLVIQVDHHIIAHPEQLHTNELALLDELETATATLLKISNAEVQAKTRVIQGTAHEVGRGVDDIMGGEGTFGRPWNHVPKNARLTGQTPGW